MMLEDKKKKGRITEKGNVLFLILIAVALFAALSYAVTQSTRSSGGDAGNETALISSAQLTQYPASIRTSVVRMIIGGVDIDELEFNIPSEFSNCAAGTNFDNCVFHPGGGGATHARTPADMMDGSGGNTLGDWVINGENEVELLGTTGGTAATADLIAFLPGITLALCNRINQELGVGTVGTPPVETDADYVTRMINTDGSTPTGMWSNSAAAVIDGDGSSDELEGQPFGCFNDGGVYVYYHVLVER